MQIRVNLVSHIAWQETKLLTGFNSRTGKYYLSYFLVLQRAYCQCYAHVRLTGTGRTCSEDHIILLVKAYQFLLVLASCRNGFARNTIHNNTFHTLLADTLSVQDMQDIFLSKTVVLHTVPLKLFHILLQCTHLQLITHNMKHIATCHDAQLGVKSLYHLDIYVIHPIEHYGIHVFQYDMLLYHLLITFVHKVTQYIWIIRHFIITLSRKS